MKQIANRFFYQLDYKNDPIPGTLARFNRKPVHGKWVEVANQCCPQPNCIEPEPEMQTITFNYLTPDVIVYKVHLIGEQGQGVYVTDNLDEINVQRTLEIPKTGTYTVVLEVVTGTEGYTISLSNSGIVGFKDAGFPTISYNAYAQDLTAVTVMNTTTPQV